MTPAEPDQDATTDPGRLVDALVQTSFAVQQVLADAAAEHDLSLAQLRLLGILRDRTAAMSELARHLGLDRSSITGLVSRAERRGLVRRTPSPDDGRGVLVELTAEARSLGVALERDVGRGVVALAAGLGATERDRLTALLELVVERTY